MKIHCLYDTMLNVNELKPHPKNRNKHSKDQIKRLAKILSYQGIRHPIKVSKRSGFITSGHGRLEAIKLNGWSSAPVNFQDYEDETQELADLTSDNSIGSWAELDLEGLGDDWISLPNFDLDLLGLKELPTLDLDLDVKEPEETKKEYKEKKMISCPSCGYEFEK